MRAALLVVVLAILVGVTAEGVLSSQTGTTKFDTPVVAACSVQVEGCDQPSLDGSRQFLISHQVLSGGCAARDLHVMRYSTEHGNARPLVAIWCS
jgi:hypothetical protein